MTKQDNTTTAASTAADMAEAARVALADTLAKAKTAGLVVLHRAYGPDADTASVTLARAVATVQAGGDKPRGATGQKINDVIKLIDAYTADAPALPIDARVYASSARVVLDKRAADAKAARKAVSEERAAAKAILNDRGVAKAARIAALEVMTEIDAKGAHTKALALEERVLAALTAARDGGVTVESITSMISDVFPNAAFTFGTVLANVA